mgnify:CR=1 FL=1
MDYVIEITLPAEGLTQDFTVPGSMQIGMLAQLSAQAFSGLTDGQYLPSAQPILCTRRSGRILDPNSVIQQTEIRNGTKLMLI